MQQWKLSANKSTREKTLPSNPIVVNCGQSYVVFPLNLQPIHNQLILFSSRIREANKLASLTER